MLPKQNDLFYRNKTIFFRITGFGSRCFVRITETDADDRTVTVGAAGDEGILSATGHAVDGALNICPCPAAETLRHIPGTIQIGDELVADLKMGAGCPDFRIGGEVTDKIFEGGSNAAVTESLNRLKNANLTEEEVKAPVQPKRRFR